MIDKDLVIEKDRLLKIAQQATSSERLTILTRIIEALPNAISGVIDNMHFSIIKDHIVESCIVEADCMKQIFWLIFIEGKKILAITHLRRYLDKSYKLSLTLDQGASHINDLIDKFTPQKAEIIEELREHYAPSGVNWKEVNANLPDVKATTLTIEDVPDVQVDVPGHPGELLTEKITI